MARRVHEQYLERCRDEGRLDPGRPTHQGWDDLRDQDRASNLDQVRSYPALLRSVGFVIVRAPDPSAINELPEPIVERAAQLEHDRWMEREIAVNPRHELICDWSELDESVRDRDRAPVRGMVANLAAVGLAVVPVTS